MKGIVLLNLVLMFGMFQSCMEPQGEITELEFEEGMAKSGLQSSAAFAATLHPILVQNCASCHGDSGSQVKHSLSNSNDAHDVITARLLVDLKNAANSSLVNKVRGSHNCWTGNCEKDANSLQAAIENWANLSVAPDDTSYVEFDRVASAEVFKTTVHPLLEDKCMQCHGDPGNQAPRHAVSDYREAHDAVIDSARVDFANIPNSRLIKRLGEDSHYCWGDCQANANEMQTLIETWASKIDTSGLTGVNGVKTTSLALSQAVVTIPETINGTIVLQAEDAVLEGRFKVKADSAASGLKYVSGDRPLPHPLEGTARVPDITGDCRIVDEAALQDSVNGRLRYTEQSRHIDQSNHRRYNQRVDFRIIRPSMRAAYRTDVIAGVTNLNKYYLTNSFDDDEDPDGILEGAPLSSTIARVLPEFARSIPDDREFFAPRFGASGAEYFAPSSADIRAGLQSGIIKEMVYKELEKDFREFFYDFEDGQWVAEDNINTVPETLLTFKDPNNPSITIEFQQNNINSSNQFYNHFFGDHLTQANSLNNEGGMRKIDSFVEYYVDPGNRGFGDFSWEEFGQNAVSFDIEKDDVRLDLLSIYTGSGALDNRTISINNYGATAKQIFVVNCVQCHGDGSGNPQFAANDDTIAYDAAASIGNFINFDNPTTARPMMRMFNERHNCGDPENCDMIGNQLVAAFNQWDARNQTDIANAQNNQDTGIIAMSDQNRTPGRAKFAFKVTEAGDYNVWMKVLSDAGTNREDFKIRILDAQGRPVRRCAASQTCITTESTYANKTPAQIDDMECETYEVGTNPQWTWYTEARENLNNRRKWTLAEGEYTLEVVEDHLDAKLDLVAISKNPDFNPYENLIDEGFISSKRPKILKYDLQPLIGKAGTFEIEVKENATSDAYIFRSPRFKGASSNLRVRDLKLLINNRYEFGNSTYTGIDRVVDGANSQILTGSSLLALNILGANTDTFAFVFKDLAATTAPAQALDDDAPVAVEGRVCQNLDLFKRTVKPVLNNFKLMFKDDYRSYTSGNEFPGQRRNTANNPTIYNCTTCHNEDHPYFKMTTFFDNDEILCAQALSRVDFGNFERSLLLRGLNGTFNHPKLNFIQSVNITGSGNGRGFQTSSTDPSGYASQFIGLRFDKWTSSLLNGYSGANREYLAGYVNRYKRIKYQRYSDVFSPSNGKIKTSGAVYDAETRIWSNVGTNLYTIDDPRNHLGDKDAITGPFKVKDSCIGDDFNNSNGVITDPCNNNVDISVEFETVKQRYRESIINWMNQEKFSYENGPN